MAGVTNLSPPSIDYAQMVVMKGQFGVHLAQVRLELCLFPLVLAHLAA
jgi:hypothetical protein